MIKLIQKSILIVFVVLPINVQAAELSNSDIMAAKFEIKSLVDSYGVYRDNYDAAGYASVFAEDGKLVIRGNAVEGRKAIQQRVENGNQNGVGLHMMGTSHINVIDSDTATGTHYVEVYSYTPKEGEEAAAYKVDGPRSIGKYIDKYIRTNEGWKIAERSFTPVFTTQ